jgi:hypothetical protein
VLRALGRSDELGALEPAHDDRPLHDSRRDRLRDQRR